MLGMRGLRLAMVLALTSGASAQAATPPLKVPSRGHFRSVLAQGEGQAATATDLANNQATGGVPPSFTSQTPLYSGIMPVAGRLTGSDLDRFYKDTDFGTIPGGAGSTTTPKTGVTIIRDARFNMAHIYGDTRASTMFGAGYATAQERLFFMDVLRHTAKGTLAALLGEGSTGDDSTQLADQDFSDTELNAQFARLATDYGAPGRRVHRDILDYIDGINARINEVLTNPLQLPAEYPALGLVPEKWTVSDSAAVGVLLVTQFTVSNGGELRLAQAQQAFRQRFGAAKWKRPYGDFREANDPQALTVSGRSFPSDDPGPVRAGRNLVPDYGTYADRDALTGAPKKPAAAAAARRAARARRPAWVNRLADFKRSLPHEESNAVLVGPDQSKDGHPLAAMGPQVGYYSPQIFSEYELHGGGLDATGVTFPGASPYPLIGHGVDFAWSGTSANGDNNDTFAETLCNPDGSKATFASTHYRYKGKCVAFVARDVVAKKPIAPTAPTPPQTFTYHALRSAHGPVFGYARKGGRALAMTVAKGVDFHEMSGFIAFMRLAENEPRDVKGFQKVMGTFPGTENWFYTGRSSNGFIQSGVYPRHARGTDVDLPMNGDGTGDWQGFNGRRYTFTSLPGAARPQLATPRHFPVISWNNKEGLGWRKGPVEWSGGPVNRAGLLRDRLAAQLRAGHGKTTLTGLTRAVNLAATTDLRMEAVYPWMRKVIGTAGGDDAALVRLLDAWRRGGAQRLDTDGDGRYQQGGGIALFDAWWPLAVRGEFEPALGKPLFDRITGGNGLPLDDEQFGAGWHTHVQKDLRAALGLRFPGRFSRVYCGAGSRSRCRAMLLRTLQAAGKAVAAKQGTDRSKWTTLVSAEQITPRTAGAVPTPPFPFQNRGTYHQVVEVARAR